MGFIRPSLSVKYIERARVRLAGSYRVRRSGRLGRAPKFHQPHAPTARPAQFYPQGPKREVMRLALRGLHAAAPSPVDVVEVPANAPFGKIEVNIDGCTLCLACVSACPTRALRDDPEFPRLRFLVDACVQCGLCKATCPEKVITLIPQLDFRAATAAPLTLKEEEPFRCIRCERPFGVKSTIEHVIGKSLAATGCMSKAPNAWTHSRLRRMSNCRGNGGRIRSAGFRASPRAHHRRLFTGTRSHAFGQKMISRSYS